jgi:hypothetical protein
LLRGLEQARRSALAHHVHRIAPMGARVLINGIRYYRNLTHRLARPAAGRGRIQKAARRVLLLPQRPGRSRDERHRQQFVK